MNIFKNFKKIFSTAQSASVPFSFSPKEVYLNSKGQSVPAQLVNDKLKAKQAICDDIVPRAKRLSADLLELKLYIQETLRKYKQWDSETYGVKIGEAGNVSIISYDSKNRIQLRSHPTTIYSPQSLEIAKELMGAVIDENTTSVAATLRKLLTDAFSVDSQLSLVSITELMKVEIEDLRWKNAVKALNEGREVVGRAFYPDVAEKDINNKWKSIPLDIAAVD